MTAADLPAVLALAERLNPDYPEDAEVFAERLRLYAAGCWVLDRSANAAGEAGDELAPPPDTASNIAGYIVSHPWRHGEPPALNARLGELPDAPTTYCIHDIALLPEVRGTGAAAAILNTLLGRARAAHLGTLSLVAVNNSASFWRHHGFEAVSDPALDEKLKSYDAAAKFMVRPL